MKEQIKNLRIHIDGLAKLAKELKSGSECNIPGCNECEKVNSKEIEKSVDSLYLAKAWLGKVLAELGEENPYKPGKKTIEDIEPTADTSKEPITWENWFVPADGLNTHIQKVDWLRQEIEKTLNSTEDLIRNHLPSTYPGATMFDRDHSTEKYYEWFFKHLCEARFWLGFEMQRIREDEPEYYKPGEFDQEKIDDIVKYQKPKNHER